LDRLGQEVVHAGREAALAILFSGARGQGDDGQVAPVVRSRSRTA
jgi:hypothetical protein